MKKESERRRMRWREMSFEETFRENMPLGYAASPAERAAFVAAMETAVRTFVRDRRDAAEPSDGAASSEGERASSAPPRSAADSEAAELMALLKLSNREVLRIELSDARHRGTKHRERARWLEDNLRLAENKAEIWRGATPASEADRVQAMERELAFLELANRLRERLGEQRTAVALLRKRERAIEQRLVLLKEDGERRK